MGTCILTTQNTRDIASVLRKEIMKVEIIPERVASSLREIIPEKYILDEGMKPVLKDYILKWIDISLKKKIPEVAKNKILSIKDNIDSIVAIATSLNQSLNEPKTNTQMLVLDLEHFEILEQVEYSMLNQLYGTAQQARTEMQNTLRTNVIASMFVNFDEGYVVKDIEHLNKNITNFLERLYQTILQYAKLKGRSTSDTNLFVDGKFMNPKNLRVLADLLFSDFNGAKLNDLFANRALANEGLALRAYNAWVILNNFDMLLKNLLGKTIVINENYKGTFQDASKLKYQLSGESNLVKTWRTSEDVNAINELGSVTKLLVESAPVYQYNKNFGLEDLPDELLYGQTLELKDVMFAFALALEHPDLKNMHMLIRYNPMLYIPMFIQSALEVTYGNNDLQIKNILYSVYKRFFQLLHKDIDTLYSLALIMNSESAKADYNVSNNLLSYITGMIDKTVPNNHLEYAIDSDTGFITTRYSSMNSLNTSKIMVLKTINNINDVLNDEDRDRLLERFKISQITDSPQVKTLFLIEFELDGTQYYIKFDNRKGELKFIEFDIVTNAGRLDYPKATGRTNDLEYKAKQALINLLDSTLHMSLAQRPELLDLLYDILPTTDPTMDKQIDSLLQLSLLAGRVLLKHEIDRGKYDDYKIDEMYGTDSNRYRKDWLNLKTGKILSVLNERQSGELITKLAQALMIINGDIAKSTVRNLEGNQVAAEGLTNLINTVKTVWNDAHQLEDSANKFCIFAQHADLLNRVAIKSAALSSDRLSVKSDRDFNVGESGYAAIMLDFLTGYAKQMVGGQYTDGRGLMQFLPTVYSDKTTNCVLVIDGNTFIQEFNKKFINLTPEEVKQYHFSTMSDMYNLLKLNITKDYQLFFNAISHTPVLETSLRASGIDPNGNYTYEQFRDIIFPIINEFANGEYTAKTPFEGKSAVQVFDSIVKPVSRVVVNVHYAGKKNLETNPVLDYHFMMYNKTDDSLYRQQIAKYLAKFAKHCLLNFRINWKNDRLEVDPKLKGAVARLGINETTYVSNWVDSKTGELIIAKTTDRRPLTRLDAESNFPENVELNPILDAFYSFDQIISTLFITSTVGGCYGHKNNFKSTNLTPGTLEYMEEEEAGRTLTLFKRMVIYPATMHNYQQELIEGCATKIKVAAIADIQAQVYNFLDAQDDIDAHDGSGFCLPWVSDWENGSLGESAAGEDKKTIGHSMDGKYLMESEFKWALFSLTNERIRNAGRVSGVNLKQLVRKMGDLAWNTYGRPFDFTKDPLGNTINLTSFGKGVFFRAEDLYLESPLASLVIPGHFYKVLSVSSSDTPNQYNIQLIEVNSQGLAIMPEAFMVLKPINSNYKLWEAFGAEYSMELYTDIAGESSLINSNSSSLLVAFYGNRAGYLRSQESEGEYKDVKEHPDHEFFYEPNTYSDDPTFKTDAELRANRALWTQRDVYQPMKYSDISYAVNPSAIKNGLTNVNPRSSWYDNTELTSFWISTKHFGVLMDADHHADDAELTEMSQVISALESNGYTHHIAKEAYRDLGAIVYAQLKPYMQAIEQHYKGDGRALYEVVGKAFLDSFQNSSSNRSDLADALVYNLKQKLGNGDSLIDAEVWIPFSDTTVLSKLISTITSLINKSAIKRKYAGIASVMVPAYDLIKIYKHLTPDGQMIDATYGGMVNTIGTTDGVRLHLNDLTENSPVLTKWDLELGKSYINLNTGERFTINTLDLYYELRSFVAPDPILYKEDFTQGRNLQPARTTYQLEDMEGTYDIYDVDAVTNKLRFSKWYSNYKDDKYRELHIVQSDGSIISLKVNKLTYILGTLSQLQNIADIADNKNVDRIISKIYNTRAFLLVNELLNLTDDINNIYLIILNNVDKIEKLTYDDSDITKLDFYVKQIGQFLQQDIVTAFHNLHEESFVVIDGQIHYVKEGTLQLQEAELVLSKIYATKFGLKPGTYLNDINEKFFLDQIRSLLAPKNELYGITLKKANGRHTYIVSNTKEEIQRLINFGYVQQDPPVRITENGTFRTDSETGEIIGPFNDCQLYVSSNGDEIIVTDDVQQFLDNDDYESILVNANNSPEMYVGILTTLDSDLVEVYKQPYNEQLLANIAKNEEKVIARAARRKWTSFQKSLEFTAARIPSQSMQSFMPMKVVGFTDSDENKAYVSHFQTFLLGSDYDIDKVYLLGNEFDDAGMYIGWSPLFDLSDIRLQKKSEELPMPTGKEIILVERNENHEANAYVQTILEIKRKLANRNLTEELRIDLKEQYLQVMSEFLNQINESDTLFVYFDPQDPNLKPTERELNWLERAVNRHQTYLSRVSDDRLVKMTKNSVSSKIRRIINDPHNMVAAYSPIEMNAPREAARKSTMGNEEREYGQLNPAVKWILHEQNMVGKKAIGITAVGEKVLFALLHYYNEVARMGGNLGRIKQIRALFNKRVPLIKGSGDEKIDIIRNIIANVNLLNTNPIWYEYINNELASIQRLSLPSLVEDPLTGETTEIAPPSLKQEDADFLSELLLMLVIAMEDSALINSALLSAATDNAKELILSKINANPDMLKIYTYCIVLGIDFNYIAELMTSSTVNTISKLAKNNIFDPRYYTKNIDTVVRTIHKGIDPERYGLKKISGEENIPGAKEYNEIYDTFKGNKDQGITPFWDKVFKSAFKGEASFKDCVEMIGLPLLTSLKNKADNILPDTTDSIMMHRYLLEVEELLNYMQNINGNDLLLFENLLESGEELNLFGRVLGINQGIRTNMADKIAYLDNFEDIFAKRLAKNAELEVGVILTKQPQLEHFGVTPEMVQATIDEALKLGMIVYNKETQSYVSNFNALKFIQDEHYKEVAIDMYDYIKNTINVFDVIDTVPHFKAMVKAAAVDFILFDENSSKFALAYNLSREVKAGQRGLNKKQRTLVDRDIVNFLSQVVTNNYFRDKGLFLSLTCDYYDERGTLHINENKEPNIIDLSTPHGLATFKHWFTTVVIPRLKKGMSSDNSDSISEGLKTNKFISDLLLTTSERTLTRDLQYIWTLPINMSNTKSVTDTNNFVGYLGAFTMLENYEYEGVNLVQLFSWYNLLVYKNQYGQDSLTRIFENYMSRPGNVMLDYFDYVGKVDYNKLLSANDFDVEDVKVNCAPEVSIWQTLQNQYLGDYIKVRDRATNTLRIYKYNAQRAAELRKKSGNVEDDPYQDYLNDMNLDYEGEDEGSIPELRPLVYDLVEPLDTNKKDIINDFAIITPSTMTYKIAKAATTILRELFNQRKVFIFNNCG